MPRSKEEPEFMNDVLYPDKATFRLYRTKKRNNYRYFSRKNPL